MNNHNRPVFALLSLLVASNLTIAQTQSGAEVAPPPATEPATVPAETPAAETPAAPAPTVTDTPTEGTTTTPAGTPAVELTPLTPPPATPEAVVVSTETSKPKDTLSVDFPDEDIRNILRNVADLFELNIVIPDTLQGRTSLKLRDVTWRQIFKVVLTPVGYTFIEDGNIIKVVTVESLAQEPLGTEVFVLNYARAEDIEKSILPLVDLATGGRVLVDKRINALIISERPSRLARISPVLTSLDKATDQVMIETKFIELNADKQRDIGLKWTAAGGITGAASTANRSFDGGPNSNPPPGTWTDQWSYSTSVLTSAQLASTLQFLENSGDSKIVSNPTVVTLNNTEAFINVGQEYPIPSYTYNTERGSFEVSGFEYKPIGIILRVTPQINAKGFIKLMVEPEISTSNATAQFGGTSTSPAAEIPIIESRKTKTQVSLKDGHTLGIGGLISETKTNGMDKLPFFGDIPGLGRLFTSKTKRQERRNLLVFITAKIVSAENAQPEEIFDTRQIKDIAIRRSDLPGYRVKDVDAFLPEEEAVPPAVTEQVRKDKKKAAMSEVEAAEAKE